MAQMHKSEAIIKQFLTGRQIPMYVQYGINQDNVYVYHHSMLPNK